MNNKSHLTAIARRALPVPVKWLLHNGHIKGYVLDYGCGKCKAVNDQFIRPLVKHMDSYDPFYEPIVPLTEMQGGGYSTVLCTYVFCVISESAEKALLEKIQSYLLPLGTAYITVRADEPRQGYGFTSKGTFQRAVHLENRGLYLLRNTLTYRIYVLTPNMNIV